MTLRKLKILLREQNHLSQRQYCSVDPKFFVENAGEQGAKGAGRGDNTVRLILNSSLRMQGSRGQREQGEGTILFG
jgi:hypothetical protein